MIERQELWCHECQKYVQFDIDVSLNGNHVIVCPECGHEHCRVVNNGRITEVRWDSRNRSNNMATYMASGTTASTASTYATYTDSGTTGSSSVYTYGAWMNLASNS